MLVARSLFRLPVLIGLALWTGTPNAQMISNTGEYDPAQAATRELDKAGGYDPNTQVLGIISNIHSDNGLDLFNQLDATSSQLMSSDPGIDRTLAPNPLPSSLGTKGLVPIGSSETGKFLQSSGINSLGSNSLGTGLAMAVSASLPNTLGNSQSSNLGFNNSSPTAAMGRFQQFSMTGLVSTSYSTALPPSNSVQGAGSGDYSIRSDVSQTALLIIPSISAGGGYLGLLYGSPVILPFTTAPTATLVLSLIGTRPLRIGIPGR